jgi:ankyrin repeat protein
MGIQELTLTERQQLNEILSADDSNSLALFIQSHSEKISNTELLALAYLEYDASLCAAFLLEQHTDPVIFENGTTIFHLIADRFSTRDTCWFDLFKKFPTILHWRDEDGKSPLNVAIDKRDIRAIKFICGVILVNLNGKNDEQLWAEFKEAFLSMFSGANFNNGVMEQALFLAEQFWNCEATTLFTADGYESTLFQAREYGVICAHFRELFAEQIQHSWFLEWAVLLNDKNLIKAYILIASAYQDQRGNTPLHYAAENLQINHDTLYALMHINIAQTNMAGETAFVLAIRAGNVFFVASFLQIILGKYNRGLSKHAENMLQLKRELVNALTTSSTAYELAKTSQQHELAEEIKRLALGRYAQTFLAEHLLPHSMLPSHSTSSIRGRHHRVAPAGIPIFKSGSAPSAIGYFGERINAWQSPENSDESDTEKSDAHKAKDTKKHKKCTIL